MITPQTEAPEIAKELGIPKLYFKREDLHPLGSHKGRSIPSMIDAKVGKGAKEFAISSSGNAALAAAQHIQRKNKEGNDLRLTIFVGEHMNEEKKKRLMAGIFDDRIRIETTPRPLQSLFNLVRGNVESLRQSTDPEALVGYHSLAHEIGGTPDLQAVFIGTSSGTAAQALAQHFIERKKDVQVHIVQVPDASPIARDWDEAYNDGARSLADAIVDRVAHRKDMLKKAMVETRGEGWIATNADIERAQRLLREKAGIEATGNGALGFAGLLRAIKKGRRFDGAVVCIITGQ